MNEILLQQLKNVPLFSSVAEKDLRLIYDKLQLVRFQKDDVIIREGDMGDCFYIIRSGRVRVETHSEEIDHPVILARLEEGDYFGEMALITGEPRSATVIAEEDVELWRLLKSDFDRLIMKNPDITLSLTHMLSHRLMKTNRALELTELQFLKKIRPRGNLEDFGLIRILNFAEQNALTGKIVLKRGEEEAVFEYDKGQLLRLNFDDKNEDEALDELLSWEEGTFLIEPSIFELQPEAESDNPEWSEEEKLIINTLERYLKEKFEEFIQFAGSRSTQVAFNKANIKLKNMFDQEEGLDIQIQPRLKIDFSKLSSFSEKHLLLLAVLLNQVVKYLSREVIGIEFWNVKSANPDTNKILEEHQFFAFFEQASELT
ncbi:MAG: cyclic nucleotide-binding domain-containing protein [Calditrichaeota bacterium]|nr:cyclic nucleotide-binding domain-containing protein [Calditrichota bacterium]